MDRPSGPTPDLVDRVERLIGQRAAAWRRPSGGYTPAERWVVTFVDGSSAFAKIATTPLTVGWLRNEQAFYEAVGDQPWLSRLLGSEDGERPMLLLEDLSSAHWPPPWTPSTVDAALGALAEIAATPAPSGLPLAAEMPDHVPLFGEPWDEVARDPRPFLGLGLCSEAWLDTALPTLLASQAAPLDGDGLLHGDFRSDNMCFSNGRAVVIDWNGAAVGNPLVDVAFWLPSLHFEGGPAPEEVAPEASSLAGIVAGFFAARAGLPDIPDGPFVRRVQREQLSTALPWACRALGLPALDGPAAVAP